MVRCFCDVAARNFGVPWPQQTWTIPLSCSMPGQYEEPESAEENHTDGHRWGDLYMTFVTFHSFLQHMLNNVSFDTPYLPYLFPFLL